MPRRLLQYAFGMFVMALGVVLLKRADLGISPISAVPAALSDITPFTLGNTTIALHIICVLGQILIVRRITLKSILTAFVGIPFGYIIDGIMLIIPPFSGLVMRTVMTVLALVISAFGIHAIVGADLMLPAPDELSHTISQVYGWKLSNVKVASDAAYVLVTLAIDLIFTRGVHTVGFGTILAVLISGRCVGLFGKLFPQLVMEPFWNIPQKK